MQNRIKRALAGALLAWSGAALAADENPSARPTLFNADSAMLAIFGTYHSQHRGTLVPSRLTAKWEIKQASLLATPLFTANYHEKGEEKGVLVVQRQPLTEGQVEESHATAPMLSVYVFKHQGEHWVFEKGKREVVEAGTHGQAPEGRLLRLGDEKYGLLFQGGGLHQGYSHEYGILVGLSEPEVGKVGEFSLGEDNAGSCSEDPKEQEGLIGECWGYEGKLQFLRDGDAPYYALRLVYDGTQADDGGRVAPMKRSDLRVMGAKGYQPAEAGRLAGAEPLPEKAVFEAGVTVR